MNTDIILAIEDRLRTHDIHSHKITFPVTLERPKICEIEISLYPIGYLSNEQVENKELLKTHILDLVSTRNARITYNDLSPIIHNHHYVTEPTRDVDDIELTIEVDISDHEYDELVYKYSSGSLFHPSLKAYKD